MKSRFLLKAHYNLKGLHYYDKLFYKILPMQSLIKCEGNPFFCKKPSRKFNSEFNRKILIKYDKLSQLRRKSSFHLVSIFSMLISKIGELGIFSYPTWTLCLDVGHIKDYKIRENQYLKVKMHHQHNVYIKLVSNQLGTHLTIFSPYD